MRQATCHTHERSSEGFALVELMVVVLIIGVLVVIATPVLIAAASHAERKACFANQRAIEGATVIWLTGPDHGDLADLVGVVGAAHPIATGQLLRPPCCPSAPSPADSAAPTSSEGAYSLDTEGSVEPCVFGGLGAHGSYR